MFEAVLLIGAVVAILIIVMARAIQPSVRASVEETANAIKASTNQMASWLVTPGSSNRVENPGTNPN